MVGNMKICDLCEFSITGQSLTFKKTNDTICINCLWEEFQKCQKEDQSVTKQDYVYTPTEPIIKHFQD
jgi:hypothetical protein